MPYCTKCGKELAEGEVCDCETKVQEVVEQSVPTEEPTIATEPVEQQESTQQPEAEPASQENVQQPASEQKTFIDPQKLNNVNEKLGSLADAGSKKVKKIVGEGKEKYEELKKDQPKFKKVLIIAAAAALVVIGLIIALCVAGGKGYMKPINSLVKEINKGKKADFTTVYSALLNDEARDYTKELAALDVDSALFYTKELAALDVEELDDLKDDMKDNFEDLSDEFDKWKISFKVSDKEKLSNEKLKDYQEELRDYWEDSAEDAVDELEDMDAEEIEDYAEVFGVSKKDFKKYINASIKYYKTYKNAKVSAGYKVRGNFVLKEGKDEIDETNKVTLYVLKINGSWGVYCSKDNESFRFEDIADKDYELYEFLEEFMNRTLCSVR